MIPISQSQELLEAISNSFNGGIISDDQHGKIIFWSQGAEMIFGFAKHEIEGKPLHVLFAHRSTEDEFFVKTLRSGKSINSYDTVWKLKTGGLVSIRINGSPLLSHSSSTSGACYVVEDTTFINQAQIEIENKARYAEDMLEGTNDGFIRLDKNYQYQYLNRRVGALIGLEPSTLIGKCVWDVFPEAVNSATFLAFRQAMDEQRYVCNVDYFPPLDLWQENHVYPTRDGLSIFIRDISDRMRAEQKIRRSEQIYKTIASNIPGSVVCMIDKDMRYTVIEGDLLKKLGYRNEDLIGRKLRDILPAERFKFIVPLLTRTFAGESFSVEEVREGIDTVTRFVPLKDDDEKVSAAMLVVLDISEIKAANRKINEMNGALEQKVKDRTRQLEEANKELEAFSYSVAHDLRTPLRAIAGYSTMLLEDYAEKFDDECKRLLNNVDRNANKMGVLIDELLTFSRLGRKLLNRSALDMNEIFQSAIDDMTKDFQNVVVKKGVLAPSFGDPSLMRHLVNNILSNALKYSSKNPSPVIEISSTMENGATIFLVKDNGVGFDMAYSDKLFGVFQRLHSHQEFDGTGVGLAIVQRIIHRHGGKVWANAVKGEGAVFYFSLPVVEA